jgi:Xaa-Pro dipeptidase
LLQSKHIKFSHVFEIPWSEFEQRRKKVIDILNEKELDCMVFFSPSSIYYLTGWEFFVTERTVAMILWADSKTEMLVPRLELEHVQMVAKGIDNVVNYTDYPGYKHPMKYLAEMLLSKGKIKIGSDNSGSPEFQGYVGPTISEVCPQCELVLMPKMIEEMRKIKSDFEISMIKESARWGNLALALLQEYTKPGLRELDVVNRACEDATNAMLKTLGPDFIPGGVFWVGAHGNYRGQIGKNSCLPHALVSNAMFHTGDIVNGSGTTYPVLGYVSELERTLFIGEPDKTQRYYFDLVYNLQQHAFNSIKPGRKCSDVDKAVMDYYKEHDLMDFWMHHTGHALGMDRHEPPFFDVADDTIIEPGMVFSVEPGIYVPDVGGFRHSDTILVTENGIELLTYYPRELDALIICG